jgi:hypothetical protein
MRRSDAFAVTGIKLAELQSDIGLVFCLEGSTARMQLMNILLGHTLERVSRI